MDTVATGGPGLSTNRRRLIARTLSLVLLLTQLGMQAHAYSHLVPEKHGAPAPVQFCGECLAYAPLLGMADSVSCIDVPHAALSEYAAPANLVSSTSRLPATAFRSRAPPAVL